MSLKVVTICGSMKFAKEMIDIAGELEKKQGWVVIQCIYNLNPSEISEAEMKNVVDAHWKKIDISDAIYVVNIDGYIGTATTNEIEYAKLKGKEVIYHEKI